MARSQQRFGQMRPDKTSTTGYQTIQNTHRIFSAGGTKQAAFRLVD
jgi:hypothetical protein